MSDEPKSALTALSNAFNSFIDSVQDTPDADIAENDCRVYLPDGDGWKAHVMKGTDRQYCYAKAPGQDFFHLIITGEIFIQKGDEKYCLMCALRQGLITTNRLYWQSPGKKVHPKSGSAPL